MKIFGILLALLLSVGFTCGPSIAWANPAPGGILTGHYQNLVQLEGQVRELQKEIAGLDAQLTSTVMTQEDHESLIGIRGEKAEKLRGLRAAALTEAYFLRDHWDELTLEQRSHVEKAITDLQ